MEEIISECAGEESGVMEEIINEYPGEVFQVKEHLMLISIRQSHHSRYNHYDAVRYAWRVNLSRLKTYNLVLARVGEFVVGAYRRERWLRATRENFPDLAKLYHDFREHSQRYGFVGERADPDIWNYYVGKRVPERFLGSRNPIRYLDPEV